MQGNISINIPARSSHVDGDALAHDRGHVHVGLELATEQLHDFRLAATRRFMQHGAPRDHAPFVHDVGSHLLGRGMEEGVEEGQVRLGQIGV